MAQCINFFTWCSTLGVGCYLYTDIKRQTPVSAGWASDGTTNWQINSAGMITGIAACAVNYRAYSFGSNGYAGTISWTDCNGTRQSVYNTGASNWTYIVPCALEGSISWSGGVQGCYMSIGFPCDCNSINTCESYTVTPTAFGSITYVNCSGDTLSIVNLTSSSGPQTICARKGSVWNRATNDYVGNILNQGVTGYTGGGTRGIVDNGLCNPVYGTFLYDQCVNCDLYAFRADGNGGAYQAEVIQYNTEACCFGGGGGGIE